MPAASHQPGERSVAEDEEAGRPRHLQQLETPASAARAVEQVLRGGHARSRMGVRCARGAPGRRAIYGCGEAGERGDEPCRLRGLRCPPFAIRLL